MQDEAGGWVMYLFYLSIYIVLVEIGIYWMHRTLHTVRFTYHQLPSIILFFLNVFCTRISSCTNTFTLFTTSTTKTRHWHHGMISDNSDSFLLWKPSSFRRCSVAFNPIDGILQASPYVAFLFVVPVLELSAINHCEQILNLRRDFSRCITSLTFFFCSSPRYGQPIFMTPW